MLDRAVPRWLRALLVVALASLPTVIVVGHFDSKYGFINLVGFGQLWTQRALPQIRPLLPPAHSRYGCDGQFYAQIAIDPSLRDRNLVSACDVVEYRARRILLPFASWCVGLGRPACVLNAYALWNIVFWFLLLTLLLYFLKPETVADWLCIAAILWTVGILVSIRFSFTDLPAATFLLLAAFAPLRFRSAAMAASILTKESYGICGWSFLADGVRAKWRWHQILGHVCLMFGPIVLWTLYVHHHFHRPLWDSGDYSWPMKGWLDAIAKMWQQHDVDGLAAASLLVQFLYLATHPRFDSTMWRIGISFAIAAAFLSDDPFIDSVSFTRDLIALTIAFNIMLMKHRTMFIPWFLAGNAGLFAVFVKMLPSTLLD